MVKMSKVATHHVFVTFPDGLNRATRTSYSAFTLPRSTVKKKRSLTDLFARVHQGKSSEYGLYKYYASAIFYVVIEFLPV